MLDFVRAFLGAAWQPEWIELDYASPRRLYHHRALPDTPVVHEATAVGLPIRRTDLPSHRKIPELLPCPLTSVDLHKHRQRFSGNPANPVLEVIDLCMMGRSKDLDVVARLLDLGPRTLQRRLTRLGMTYRQLVEQARRRRAVALLRETERPVKAIAMDLGYREPDNFTRAFRSWFGRSPTAFRAGEWEGESKMARADPAGPHEVVAK